MEAVVDFFRKLAPPLRLFVIHSGLDMKIDSPHLTFLEASQTMSNGLIVDSVSIGETGQFGLVSLGYVYLAHFLYLLYFIPEF